MTAASESSAPAHRPALDRRWPRLLRGLGARLTSTSARFGAPAVDFEVRAVRSRADVARFLDLPRRLRGRSRGWVEPLRVEQASLLDQRRHPFYGRGHRARAEFFLAVDKSTGRAVGRVAAIRVYVPVAGVPPASQVGHFGFFDAVDSPPVARVLLDAACAWLLEQGATLMLGPASPSQNYEYGLLVDGFDEPHRFLLPHNPPYYDALLAGYGLEKARDLFVFSATLNDERIRRKVERDLRQLETSWRERVQDVVVRPIDFGRIEEEARVVARVMSDAFVEHWGYTPFAVEELTATARKLRLLADPNLILIAEHRGKPAGIALAVPDLNGAIGALRCRDTVLELVELLVRAKLRRTKCARCLVLGVANNSGRGARVGLAPYLWLRLYQNLVAGGYSVLDAHWILEDNLPMLRVIERYGGRRDRVYRVYEKYLL